MLLPPHDTSIKRANTQAPRLLITVAAAAVITSACAPMPADQTRSVNSTYQRITNYISTGKPSKTTPTSISLADQQDDANKQQKKRGGFWPFYRAESDTKASPTTAATLTETQAPFSSSTQAERAAQPSASTVSTTTPTTETAQSSNNSSNNSTFLSFLQDKTGIGISPGHDSGGNQQNDSPSTASATAWPPKKHASTSEMPVNNPLIDTAQQLRGMPVNTSIADLYSGRFHPKQPDLENDTISENSRSGFAKLWDRFTHVFSNEDDQNEVAPPLSPEISKNTTQASPVAIVTPQSASSQKSTPPQKSTPAQKSTPVQKSTPTQESTSPQSTQSNPVAEQANLDTQNTLLTKAPSISTNSMPTTTPTMVSPPSPTPANPTPSPINHPTKSAKKSTEKSTKKIEEKTISKKNTVQPKARVTPSADLKTNNAISIALKNNPIMITALDLTVTDLNANNDDGASTMNERTLALITKGAIDDTDLYDFVSPANAETLKAPNTLSATMQNPLSKPMTLLHHIIIRQDTNWDQQYTAHTTPQAVLLMKLKDNETGVHLTDTRRTIALTPEQTRSIQSMKKAITPLITEMLSELAISAYASLERNEPSANAYDNAYDNTNDNSYYSPNSAQHPSKQSLNEDTTYSHVLDLSDAALKNQSNSDSSRFQVITVTPTTSTRSEPTSNSPTQSSSTQGSPSQGSLSQQKLATSSLFYSIQIQHSSTLAYLKDYVRNLSLDSDEIQIVRQKAGKHIRYIAIYGHFDSAGDAQSSLHLLPEDVLSEGAFVRRINLSHPLSAG